MLNCKTSEAVGRLLVRPTRGFLQRSPAGLRRGSGKTPKTRPKSSTSRECCPCNKLRLVRGGPHRVWDLCLQLLLTWGVTPGSIPGAFLEHVLCPQSRKAARYAQRMLKECVPGSSPRGSIIIKSPDPKLCGGLRLTNLGILHAHWEAAVVQGTRLGLAARRSCPP